MTISTEIIEGNNLEVLKDFPDNHFNLIMTSPPYADKRMSTYGGVKPELYSEWFLPMSKEFKRVLREDGTFILNIKEGLTNKTRQTYVMKLIFDLIEQGWLWTEEFIWVKNGFPGKYPNRLKDCFERIFQFNKNIKFNMYHENVMVDAKPAHIERTNRISKKDIEMVGKEYISNSGYLVPDRSRFKNKDKVLPGNVQKFNTGRSGIRHPAIYPESLPKWFIKLFTQENDIVLDPFSGSGTTCKVAQDLNRNSIGIEKMPEYVEISRDRIEKARKKQMPLSDILS